MGMVTSAPEMTSTHLEQKLLELGEDLCTRYHTRLLGYPFCSHPAAQVPQELQETQPRRGYRVRASNLGTKLNHPEGPKSGRRLDTKPGYSVRGQGPWVPFCSSSPASFRRISQHFFALGQ